MDSNVELTGKVEDYFEQILAQQLQVRRIACRRFRTRLSGGDSRNCNGFGVDCAI